MFLKRRIVLTLQESYHRKQGWAVTREGLKNHMLQKKWPRWNYPWWSDQEYENEIFLVLGDCIEGLNGPNYISYLDDRIHLQVTAKGRDFIKWDGFINEYLKGRSNLMTFLGGGVASAVISAILWLISHFYG